MRRGPDAPAERLPSRRLGVAERSIRPIDSIGTAVVLGAVQVTFRPSATEIQEKVESPTPNEKSSTDVLGHSPPPNWEKEESPGVPNVEQLACVSTLKNRDQQRHLGEMARSGGGRGRELRDYGSGGGWRDGAIGRKGGRARRDGGRGGERRRRGRDVSRCAAGNGTGNGWVRTD
ncbi:hypothetical protein DAI22_02g358950 [Oryza sativa Japonica Group]|nr:hypothetical protein DAI22_02g358950 [Oryza sativa Japonica Group]